MTNGIFGSLNCYTSYSKLHNILIAITNCYYNLPVYYPVMTAVVSLN